MMPKLILVIKTRGNLTAGLNITIVTTAIAKRTTTVINSISQRSTEIETMKESKGKGQGRSTRMTITAMSNQAIRGEHLGQEVQVIRAMSTSKEIAK